MLRSIGLLLALATLFTVSSALMHHVHRHKGGANDILPESEFGLYELKLYPSRPGRPIHHPNADDYYNGESTDSLQVLIGGCDPLCPPPG